jgi:hypothetical protein
VQLGFTEQRLDRAHDRVLAADLDSIADLERLLAAEVAGRDHLVGAAELIAIVDPSQRRPGRYALAHPLRSVLGVQRVGRLALSLHHQESSS